MRFASSKGFTLSELLIALAILGLIATFTIPKVLQAVGTSSNKTIAKEVASTISQAYDGVKADGNGVANATVTAATLVAKMNYSQALTSGNTVNGVACAAAAPACYQLHSGGVMQVNTADAFTTDDIGTIAFNLDPDGINGSNGPITFVLGHDGRLMTGGTTASFTGGTPPAAYTFAGSVATVAADPTWFSWQ